MKNNKILIILVMGMIAASGNAMAGGVATSYGCYCSDGTNYSECDPYCSSATKNCVHMSCDDGRKECAPYAGREYDSYCQIWTDVSGSENNQQTTVNGTIYYRCKAGWGGPERLATSLIPCIPCQFYTYSGNSLGGCYTPDSGYYATGCESDGLHCTGQKQCESGYYCEDGKREQCPTSNGTAGKSNPGAAAKTECYIPSGGTFSDDIGSGTVADNCYWAD